MKLLIKGARCLDPATQTDVVTDIFIENETIVGLGHLAGFEPDTVEDASGMWVIPGAVDTACHLREPGQSEKGSIASETKAAALAGVLHCMSYPDTLPVLDNSALVHQVLRSAQSANWATVHPIGALTKGLLGQQLSDLTALRDVGCPAVTNAQYTMANPLVTLQCYQYAANFEIPVIVHPLDKDLYAGTAMHEGEVSTRLGLPSAPVSAETLALAQHIELAAHTGARVHFACLSAGRSVQMIAQAKAAGLSVTASVAAHHLHLTEMDVSDFNSNMHLMPPLRSERDQQLLKQGVADGTIDCICSDHQPHEATAKLAPFGESATGMSSVETLLGLVIKLHTQGDLPLLRAIETVTSGAAGLFGLEAGRLAVGAKADIVVLDPRDGMAVTPSAFHSKGKNTAFAGWHLPVRVVSSYKSGQKLRA